MSQRQDIVHSAGGITFDQAGQVLLIERRGGGYGLPKGHVEDGESFEQAAIREMYEETGYQCEIIRHLGVIERKSYEPDGRLADKQIDMFLMHIVGGTLGSDEEAPLWVPFAEAVSGLYHPEEQAFLAKQQPNMISQ